MKKFSMRRAVTRNRTERSARSVVLVVVVVVVVLDCVVGVVVGFIEEDPVSMVLDGNNTPSASPFSFSSSSPTTLFPFCFGCLDKRVFVIVIAISVVVVSSRVYKPQTVSNNTTKALVTTVGTTLATTALRNDAATQRCIMGRLGFRDS